MLTLTRPLRGPVEGAVKRQLKHKSIPQKQRRPNFPASRFFGLNYRPGYEPRMLHFERNMYSPILRAIAEDKDSKMPREGLWWKTHSPAKVSQKATVRTWCARRVKEAFIAALKERGFNEHACGLGPLADAVSGGNGEEPAKVATELRGTMVFVLTKASITGKWEDLKEACLGIVDSLADFQHSQSNSSGVPSGPRHMFTTSSGQR